MEKKLFDKQILIKYFTTDNKSGYKTKESHVKLNFNGLMDEINLFNLRFEDIPFTQKLYNYLYDIVEIPKCRVCGNDLKWRNRFTEGYLKVCDRTCMKNDTNRVDNIKQTTIEKYGVDSISKVDDIKNRRKETYKQKYGNENIFESDLVKIKTKKTLKKKYGVQHASQSDQIKKKIKVNNLKKYGVDNPSKLESVKDKLRNHYLLKLKKLFLKRGYEILSILPESVLEVKHPDGHVFYEKRSLLLQRYRFGIELSTTLLPKGNSNGELELKKYVEDIGFTPIVNNRKLLDGKEIDIFIEDKKFAIEYNGLFWHSEIFKEPEYHLNKTEIASTQNIQLIHIFEDEWLYKSDIVKSIINSKLGIFKQKIYARKCLIREITSKESADFLGKNHIQGNVNSSIRIGLFYENELVSIMTFGNLRKSMGKSSKESYYEMYRFCNKLNTTVIGGASKLLKYFINTYKPKSIITYADRRYSNGHLYQKLGFDFVKSTNINYWYFDKSELIRYHRFKFRKDVLIKEGFDPTKTEHEIMLERGYLRIYDCGNIKYEMIL